MLHFTAALLFLFSQAGSSSLPPNNSFKPNLLRYGNDVAEEACHAVASTAQAGLTQALDRTGTLCESPSTY